jgi:hypothetical protein
MNIVLPAALERRDILRIPKQELLIAARWWCIGAVRMPTIDPWRSHLALVPNIALMAPNALSLAGWLDNAHTITKGTNATTIYEGCFVELHMALSPARVSSKCTKK